MIAARLRLEELTRRRRSDDYLRWVESFRCSTIDPNPHQVEAAMFALGRLPQGGALLCDEIENVLANLPPQRRFFLAEEQRRSHLVFFGHGQDTGIDGQLSLPQLGNLQEGLGLNRIVACEALSTLQGGIEGRLRLLQIRITLLVGRIQDHVTQGLA